MKQKTEGKQTGLFTARPLERKSTVIHCSIIGRDSVTSISARFDEGVFGNYGWKVPVGRSGLVGWDALGSKIDSLEKDKEYSIFECLALNGVADGGIWFFFSIDSKIGVRKEGLTSYYSPEDIYFRTFAVNGETIVAHRGSGERALFELQREGNEYKIVRKIELTKPNGKPIEPQLVNNRENKLLFLDGDELYIYEVKSSV